MTSTLRIAAVGDIHCGRTPRAALQQLFAQVAECADVLLLCGDLVDYGLEEEVAILLEELAPVKSVPTVAVLGNHDFEAGRPDRVKQLLCDGGVTVLDGDACEIKGIGFAGTKGFGGGFGRRALQPWGEPMIKGFVREAVDEALKLESGLARLRTRHRIALLHYAPIQATVEGEPPEIFPFLGSSRLEEPIDRYEVTAVVHGHAHAGTPEGRTSGGVPVYNVSMPLLERAFPERPPFRLLELQVERAAARPPSGRPAAEPIAPPR
jgi:Icc-related predicted phosphoesterase